MRSSSTPASQPSAACSTPIARYIYESGTKHGKRVQALGGAKNHMIVLPDADIDMAADAAVSWRTAPRASRMAGEIGVLAVGDVAEPLVAAITERLLKITVGPGLEDGLEMGPLITRAPGAKVASYIASGAEQARRLRRRRPRVRQDGDGFFLGVSLLDDVTPEMDCYQNEIFGPVLEVVRADTYDEAVGLVNANPYGNGVAMFTRDGRRGAAVPVRCTTSAWSASSC